MCSLLLQIIYDRVTNRSRGFAFVTMATAQEAAKAIEMFDGAVSSTPIGLDQFLLNSQNWGLAYAHQCVCVLT
jgi:RNA recognition motif-containing protein